MNTKSQEGAEKKQDGGGQEKDGNNRKETEGKRSQRKVDTSQNGDLDSDSLLDGKDEKPLIVPFLLDLLFEKLLTVMKELSIDQIRFEYWSQGSKEVDQATFNTQKNQNKITPLCLYLKHYFSQ